MRKLFIHIIIICLCCIHMCGYAQNNNHIYIKNKVIDSETNEGIPFVNIALKINPTIGTSSDDNGDFELKLNSTDDTLVISSVGYQMKAFTIEQILSSKSLKLSPIWLELQGVIIKAGFNRAWSIVRKINKHRHINNPDKIRDFDYKQYTKNTITIENINLSKKAHKYYNKVKDALIIVNDSLYTLPIMINEDVTKCYVNNKGIITSQIIGEKNNGISFFENTSFREITGDMVESTNFYDNYIALLSKYIPSPVGKHNRLYYKMYVSDSLTRNDQTTQYKINFFPRNNNDLALNGYFWVDTETWAITDVYAQLLQMTNINFIRGFVIHNTYQKFRGNERFYNKKETDVIFDYNFIEENIEERENVTVRIRKVRFFNEVSANNLRDKTDSLPPIHFDKDIVRPEPLGEYEKVIDEKINILKEKPFIVFIDKSINMLMNGYYEQGKIDIGPVSDFYTHNLVEGSRFNFGLRTNKNLWVNNSIGGFIGYGKKNKKWRYGVTLLHRFKRMSYNKLTVNYWNDVMPVGNNDNLALIRENAYSKSLDNNIISSLFSVSPLKNLISQQHLSLSFENDLRKGLTQLVTIQKNRLWDSPFIKFGTYNHFDYAEASYTIRLSFKEHYFDEYFHRIYHGNKYPVLHLKTAIGQYFLNDESTTYGSVHFIIKHRLNIGIGIFRYLAETGIILGEVPFPLLNISRGNQTYGLARYDFNVLNFMEYGSDKYASLHGNITTNGLLFNRLPLIKKLKLRECVSINALWGSLSKKHEKVMPFPSDFSQPSNPYVEVGVGFTNFLKALHIEYVFRLTDREKPNVQKSGIRARFEFSF